MLLFLPEKDICQFCPQGFENPIFTDFYEYLVVKLCEENRPIAARSLLERISQTLSMVMCLAKNLVNKGLFGFVVSITHNSVSITHNSKMVGPMTKKSIWIFITQFFVFVSITQFSDF